MGECPWGEGPVCKAWECAFRDHTVQVRVVDHDLEIIMCRENFFGCVVSCKILWSLLAVRDEGVHGL